MTQLNLENFENEIMTHDMYLVDFYADWCGPCKMLAPIIEDVAADHPELVVGRMNIDEAYPIAEHFGIQSIPTVILFEKGIEKSRNIGFCMQDELEQNLGLRK